MSVETEDDRAAFFDPDVFARTASYSPLEGAVVQLNIILDVEIVRPSSEYGGSTAIEIIDATCQTADLPDGAGDGDEVELEDGRRYRVRSVKRDGEGISMLSLEVAD